MKYLKVFKNTALQEAFRNSSDYIQPHVSCITTGESVQYNKTDEVMLRAPLTVQALSSGNITWSLGDKTVMYSKNGGSWQTMDKDTSISVVGGDKVEFKGNNASYSNSSFSSTALFNLKGNIMSIIIESGFDDESNFGSFYFGSLFMNCTNLRSAHTLIFPATTLTSSYCYADMFKGCTNLTTAPSILPATTLTESCYSSMFQGCTSLTTVPELPATTLANTCYGFMFYNCTSLTTAPALPATTLAQGCYTYMFSGCTSLTSAPELPATSLVTACYISMFQGCTSLNYVKALFISLPNQYTYTASWLSNVSVNGTFVKNSSANWNLSGESGIPSGWTIQTASS